MTARGDGPGVITVARPGRTGGEPGGSAALLRSPLVGSNIDLTRVREPDRKIDL